MIEPQDFHPDDPNNMTQEDYDRVYMDLKRRDTVIYTGDDAFRGYVGTVTRTGLERLGEPAVEVTFREGRRQFRKEVRVSRLERSEGVA